MPQRIARYSFAFFCLLGLLRAERSVDPVNVQEQMIVVVPLIGSGSLEDPKRPLFAPTSGNFDGKGTTGYKFVLADDGKTAIVQFTAPSAKAFAAIAADSRVVRAFQKGKDQPVDIERELKRLKASFDLEAFAGRVK